MSTLRNWSVSALLRGRDGMGVGRAEAAEFARRFDVTATAVKNHGEWFVVLPRTISTKAAWSIGQVATHLQLEGDAGRRLSHPEPRFVLRSNPAGDVFVFQPGAEVRLQKNLRGRVVSDDGEGSFVRVSVYGRPGDPVEVARWELELASC